MPSNRRKFVQKSNFYYTQQTLTHPCAVIFLPGKERRATIKNPTRLTLNQPNRLSNGYKSGLNLNPVGAAAVAGIFLHGHGGKEA